VWLRSRFISESGTPIDLNQIFKQLSHESGQLAPLYFLPFSDKANEIKQARVSVIKEFNETLDRLERFELKEMDAFNAKSPPEGESFIPSNFLESTLEKQAVVVYKNRLVANWESLFSRVLVDLLGGKSTIENAEGELQQIDYSELYFIGRGRNEEATKDIEETYNSFASNWESDKWEARREYLKKIRDVHV